MRKRWVFIPIDTINAIFADYAGKVDFPPDAQPVTLKLNPSDRKLMLVVEADSIPPGEDGQVELLKFHLQRVMGVA